MNKFPDFWGVVFGHGPIGIFLGFLVIAYVAALASVLIDVSKRDPTSANTPEKFSFKFLLAANLSRFAANVLLIGLFIRVIYEYASPTMMLFLSIGIGFGVDRLAMLAKKYGILTTDKIAARVAEKLSDNPDSPSKN